jgi:hypothetical protein
MRNMSLLLVLLNAGAYAQPTLQWQDQIVTPFDQWTYYGVAYSNSGIPAENVYWDYSDLVPLDTTFAQGHVPSTTPYDAQFPVATAATSVGDAYEYVQLDANQLLNLGNFSGSSSLIYSDPRKDMQFPLAYNNAWLDDIAGNGSTPIDSYSLTGSIIGAADAWGTLLLPYGEVGNILRVRTIQTLTKNYFSGTQEDVYFEAVGFFTPGINTPLLVFFIGSSTIAGNTANFEGGFYAADLGTGISDAPAGTSLFLQMEPGQESALLRWQEPNAQWVYVHDAAGRNRTSMRLAQGQSQAQLPLINLVAGAYTVQVVFADGRRAVARFAKSF